MNKIYDSVVVRIRNQEDLNDFAKLIGKMNISFPVTKKTRKRTIDFYKDATLFEELMENEDE